MKKEVFLAIAAVAILATSSVAQKKYVSRGYVRVGATIFVPWASQNEALFFPALNITPGFRIVQGNDFALIATLPVSGGVVMDDGWELSYFGFDVPAMLEMHFGSATGNAINKSAGFVLGAGAGYHYTGEYTYPYHYDNNTLPTEYEYRHLDFWGYRLAAGVSFGKDNSGSGDRYLIMGQFGQAFGSEKKYTVGWGFYAILGNRKKLSERTDF